MSVSRTIIISCAGMGNRLGLGTTKALIEVCGKTIIERHLEFLNDEEDVRVVVGYQAERVIDAVKRIRNDVLFVFNHDFKNTGTGASVALASKLANEFVLSLDGDILIHPDDMKKILDFNEEFVGGNPPKTEEPWFLQTYEENGREYVSAFDKNMGTYEWNGVTQMKSVKMLNGTGHVFQLIEPYLPIRFMNIRTREIDTMTDYYQAVKWVENNFGDHIGN